MKKYIYKLSKSGREEIKREDKPCSNWDTVLDFGQPSYTMIQQIAREKILKICEEYDL